MPRLGRGFPFPVRRFPARVLPSPQTVSPTGIASAETFGTPAVTNQLSPTGIASGEAFGSPTISKAQLENTAEGGSDGTTVTTGNSGGTSLDAFDIVSIGGSSAIIFSSAHAHDGSLSYKFSRSGGVCSVGWSTSLEDQDGTLYFRAFVYLTAYPSAQIDLLKLTNAAASETSRVDMLNTGRLRLVDTSTLVGSTTSIVPLNQWVRVEAKLDTVGNVAELRLYLDADSNVADDDVTVTTGTFLSDVAQAEWGIQGAVTLDSLWLDSLKVSPTGWIGPTTQKIQPTGIASSEAFGTPTVSLQVSPNGIASGEGIGSPTVNLLAQPTGVASGEAFGSPTVNLLVQPSSITSGEAFGVPTVIRAGEPITVFPTGIPSSETFGTPTVNLLVRPTGIGSAEAFGSPYVHGPIEIPAIPDLRPPVAPLLYSPLLAQPARTTPGMLAGVEDLILEGAELSGDLLSAVTAAELGRTIDGASTITLTLEDPDLALLLSDVLASRNDLRFDGLHFEAVALAKSGRTLTVTFEALGVAELRRKKGPLGIVDASVGRYEQALRIVSSVPFLSFVGEPDSASSVVAPTSTVGSPQQPDEDHWSALQRMAGDIKWRCFEDQATVYFGSDEWLSQLLDPVILSESTEGIDQIDFENDRGKRASSAQVSCWAHVWGARPGAPVKLQDLGKLTEGIWIVQTISRSLFSAKTSVSLTRKVKELQPPTTTLVVPGSGGTRAPVTLTVDQALALGYVVGWRGHDLVYATAIMGRESGRQEDARNLNTNGSIDRGLFQINNHAWSGISDACCYNGLCNARQAHDTIWAAAGFAPWSSTHDPDRHFYELLQEAQRRYDAGRWRDFVGSIASIFTDAGAPGDPGNILATCPVPGGAPTDSFGADRYGGGYHLHKGSDIMAPRGTPAVAPFNGRAEDATNTLGGNAVHITGSEGYVYMAHFDRIVTLGPVLVGDIVGLVGDSGDAKGGPTHCHFEIHPNVVPTNVPKSAYGYSVIEGAINPYPYLEAVCR